MLEFQQGKVIQSEEVSFNVPSSTLTITEDVTHLLQNVYVNRKKSV